MKFARYLFALLIAVTALGAGTLSSHAATAPTAHYSVAIPAAQEAFTTTGQIHPWGRAYEDKCLTTTDDAPEHSIMWWAPCLPAKSPFAVWQRFFAYRIVDPTHHVFNVGEISLAAHPDVSVCRHGSGTDIVVCDTIHHPSPNEHTIMHFKQWTSTTAEGKWTVSVLPGYFMSGNLKFVPGRLNVAIWSKVKKNEIQFVAFQHPWHELAKNPVRKPLGIRLTSTTYSPIQYVNPQFCLNDPQNSTVNGTQMNLWQCDGKVQQQFRFNYNADFQAYNIQLENGKCLSDPLASGDNGTKLQIWTCNDNAAQNWYPLIPANGGFFSDPNGESWCIVTGGVGYTMCINLPQSNINNGQPINVWQYLDGVGEDWWNSQFA